MGTARLFNRLLKSELNIHAAWLPVTNTFQLGDYGLISDGVLVKVGNIKQHGISFKSAKGQPAKMAFASQSVSVSRAVAGAKVEGFPDQNLDARLSVEFGEESAFFLRGMLSLEEMQNVRQVADKLADAKSWKGTYRVVSGVYSAERCVILSSKSAGARFELGGSASALQKLEGGSVEAGVHLTSADKLGLDIAGDGGVVGLGLFKLNWLTGGLRVMGEQHDTAKPADAGSPSSAAAGFETHLTWREDLEDDI
jgi:hypothetical protein